MPAGQKERREIDDGVSGVETDSRYITGEISGTG